MSDYPQLDEAMLNGMVEDFERNKDLEATVPLPPKEMLETKQKDEPSVPLELPPEFTTIEEKQEETIAPKPIKQEKTLVEKPNNDVEIRKDVENLALMENVFDKRVTNEQVDAEIKKEQNKNDSGRLLDKKDVEVKTELNDVEIVTIAKLDFIAERYKIPALNEFTNKLMTLKISRNRKGRGEFIQGLHADERRDTGGEQGFFSKLFNRGSGQ